jgi:DNA polymerase-3 subunit epsilon
VELIRRPRTPAARTYAYTPLPEGRTPWRGAGFCVVDLETTGLNPGMDEIVSFAAIPVDGGRVMPGGLVTRVVKPERMPPPETIRIHGFRPMDLVDAPPLADVLDDLLEAMCGRILVAHVAWVERRFLGAAFRGHGVRLRGKAVDTARLGPAVLGRQPGDRGLGLGELARKLGLPIHRAHTADGDALTTAQAFIALAARLDGSRPQTVRSLLRLGRGREPRYRPPRRRA